MERSVTASEIKLVKSLAHKKFRDETGLFIVEGEKMVEEALASGFAVEAVYREAEIGEKAMSRLSMMATTSPALAVVRKPEWLEAEPAKLPSQGLFLVLDGIRDPGNLGTIVRIADWFGIDGIFASRDTVDLFNPKVVQATMGAVFRVRFQYGCIPAICKAALKSGGRVYGTFLDGKNIYAQDISTGEDSPSLIVIGNESNGISTEVAACVSDSLLIPPYPEDQRSSESLNAAVATAVTVAEFRRRTMKHKPLKSNNIR